MSASPHSTHSHPFRMKTTYCLFYVKTDTFDSPSHKGKYRQTDRRTDGQTIGPTTWLGTRYSLAKLILYNPVTSMWSDRRGDAGWMASWLVMVVAIKVVLAICMHIACSHQAEIVVKIVPTEMIGLATTLSAMPSSLSLISILLLQFPFCCLCSNCLCLLLLMGAEPIIKHHHYWLLIQ